jgi:DNA-binding NarL/FixJ family response regulator
MSKKSITVLVVDDHEIVRRGIITLLETEPDIKILGQAENGREGLALAEKLQPDVILMDLVMPEMDGVEAIREIRERGLSSHVLVLTSFGSDDKLFPAVRAGALRHRPKSP